MAALPLVRYPTRHPYIPYYNAIDYLRTSFRAIQFPVLGELQEILSDPYNCRIWFDRKCPLDHLTWSARHNHKGHTQLPWPFQHMHRNRVAHLHRYTITIVAKLFLRYCLFGAVRIDHHILLAQRRGAQLQNSDIEMLDAVVCAHCGIPHIDYERSSYARHIH